MNIGLERSEGTAVLRAGGRLTASAASRLREALLEAFEGSRRLELALGAVEEADLTFLQVVCAAHRTAAARAVGFSVTGLEAGPVGRLLREAGAAPGEGCPPGCLLQLGDVAPGAGPRCAAEEAS